MNTRHMVSHLIRHGSDVSRRLSTGITLRDYQLEAVQALHDAIAEGVRRPAIVLATGGGKTVVFSHIIPQIVPLSPQRGNKTLVLAHKEELVRQAAKVIKQMSPELNVEIDMRTLKPSEHADVIVGSVPTLVRASRLEKYNPMDFKTIIIDECHHATALSWVKILTYFNAHTPELEIYVLGFTATLERSDGQNLGLIFDKVVFERTLMQMIKNKELVNVKFSTIGAKIDLSNVSAKKHDYDVSSLSEAMNDPDVNDRVALSYIKLQKEYNFKSTLIFCVDINHCKTLCSVLQGLGVNAQYVTGTTTKHERQAIIEDFKNGKIEVLCNVQVFTEGTDIPNIDCLVLARPTKSRILLIQMIGRGLRLHEGKENCHVIDIADTIGTGVQSVPTLFSLPPDFKVHGKNFQELVKDKEDYDEEMEKLALESRLRKEKEESAELKRKTAQLARLKEVAHEIGIQVKTLDGFVSLITEDSNKYKSNSKVNEQFNKSHLNWARFEYNLWGCELQDNRFMLVERDEKDGSYLFKATLHTFASRIQVLLSKFMCPKHFVVSTITPALEQLISVITDCERVHQNSHIRYGSPSKAEITDAQYQFLLPKMKIQMKKHYKVTPELDQQLVAKLQKISRRAASNLIFALKFSTNSLCVRWELNKLLGPDRQLQKLYIHEVPIEAAIKELVIED